MMPDRATPPSRLYRPLKIVRLFHQDNYHYLQSEINFSVNHVTMCGYSM